jgi:hypothetical protein
MLGLNSEPLVPQRNIPRSPQPDLQQHPVSPMARLMSATPVARGGPVAKSASFKAGRVIIRKKQSQPRPKLRICGPSDPGSPIGSPNGSRMLSNLLPEFAETGKAATKGNGSAQSALARIAQKYVTAFESVNAAERNSNAAILTLLSNALQDLAQAAPEAEELFNGVASLLRKCGSLSPHSPTTAQPPPAAPSRPGRMIRLLSKGKFHDRQRQGLTVVSNRSKLANLPNVSSLASLPTPSKETNVWAKPNAAEKTPQLVEDVDANQPEVPIAWQLSAQSSPHPAEKISHKDRALIQDRIEDCPTGASNPRRSGSHRECLLKGQDQEQAQVQVQVQAQGRSGNKRTRPYIPRLQLEKVRRWVDSND